MTTIIVIVVVALVFFVSICVAAFIVWKRESEMRTDSIRAIERKLESLGTDLKDISISTDISDVESVRRESECSDTEQEHSKIVRQGSGDPFSWMRTEAGQEEEPRRTESEIFENDTIQHIEDNSVKEHVSNDIVIAEKEPEAELACSCVGSGLNEKDRIYADIDLDFAEIQNLVSENRNTAADFEECVSKAGACVYEMRSEEESETDKIISDGDVKVFTEVKKSPMSHNVGKSGRKYTAEELETLIKE